MRHAWSRIFPYLALLIAVGYVHAQSSPAATSIPSYLDTPAGLEHLMTDMLSLQKDGKTEALSPYLQSLVLPDLDSWFSSKFGDVRCGEQQLGPNDCLGPRMAYSYSSLANGLPASFSRTLNDFLHDGLTSFEATNYTEDCPGPQRIIPSWELVGGLTTTPHLSSLLSGLVQRREPLYVLWAYSESKETTLPFFVYSAGAFRYIGMLHPASVEDSQKTKAAEAATRPAPATHNLSEDQIRMKKVIIDPAIVERTIVLHVSVDRDGKPKEVTFVRGLEAEKEAAIRSVMKRHFDRPGFGPGGLHPNLFCLTLVGPQ
jgi:hypothetical protein